MQRISLFHKFYPKLLGNSIHDGFKNAEKFVLYSSDDCSLCVHFKKHLDTFLDRNKLDIRLEIRDIRQCDPSTFERFKHDVPVLTAGDTVVCKHRFSTILFKRYLGIEEK